MLRHREREKEREESAGERGGEEQKALKKKEKLEREDKWKTRERREAGEQQEGKEKGTTNILQAFFSIKYKYIIFWMLFVKCQSHDNINPKASVCSDSCCVHVSITF